MDSIYLIGSLRNPEVGPLAIEMRQWGYDVFDDWRAAGPEADDMWKAYEIERGQTYAQALEGYAAHHVFNFDLEHLNRCQIGVLVMPAGKSCFLELGYLRGQEKDTYILYPNGDPDDRFDVMFLFAKKVCFSMEELKECLVSRKSSRPSKTTEPIELDIGI